MTEQSVDEFLEHYGVKGMRWGVRKDDDSSYSYPTNKESQIHISPSGAITLKKGASLQRVVQKAKGGEDFSDDVTYASFSKLDNRNYENMLGRRASIFNKEASEVITLTAKTDLKAPSSKEASSIFFKTLQKDPAAMAEAEVLLSQKSMFFVRRNFEKALKDPTSDEAVVNYGLLYNEGNYPKAPSKPNRAFHKELQKAGYNMLRDEMDISVGVAESPVILLNPKQTVSIAHRRTIDRQSVRANRRALAELDKELRRVDKEMRQTDDLQEQGYFMDNEEEVDEFLAHYGVKGMRWGVRREGEGGAPREPMSASTKKKIVIGAAVGTALVGVAASAVILKKNGTIPVSALRASATTFSASRSAAKATAKASRARTAAKTAERGKQAVQVMREANALATRMKEFEAMMKADNNTLYKHMVDDAARSGVPTISRQEFDDIRG